MHAIGKWISAVLTRVCAILKVSPQALIKDKRGNLPPPSGGIGSF
jgi:hypothetical protein